MNKGLSDYTGLGTNSVVNINAVRSGKSEGKLGGKSDPEWMKKYPCFTCTSLSHTMSNSFKNR